MVNQKNLYRTSTRQHNHMSMRLSIDKRHSITVYSTSICPWCSMTKSFLRENKIKFKEINVGRNINALKEMVNKSGQMGVPVIDINGSIIIGFDEDSLREKLNL